MTPLELENLAHLRRARDLIDREYARPLDVPTMAQRALMSPAHFSRKFRAAYGETPYSYLVTRRVERAMALLRSGATVTDACMAVGATSLGVSPAIAVKLALNEPPCRRRRDVARLVQRELHGDRGGDAERLPRPRAHRRRGHARLHRAAAHPAEQDSRSGRRARFVV
jgi:AraC-like DNA-binding protein